MRLLPALALVTVLAGCVAPVEVGSVAPDFTATNLASNEAVSFTEAYAGQVTLVNIWATWCEPCKEEIPALQELYETMGPRGLKIAAVSIDEAGPEVVREFMAGFGVTFDVLHDPAGAIQQTYRTTGVPESFLVARDGRIMRIVYGDHPWASDANRRIIEQLLDAPAS
jgi:cytochrome c biogenesis protein CcmG, thiol:disulfide interchange protein DsbE